MPWAEWICCLYKARQIDEYDRFYQYSLAGGDAKKWVWQYRRETDVQAQGQNITGSIMTQWRAAQLKSGGKLGAPMKGNLEQAADMGIVKRAKQLPDGRIVDVDGQIMDMPPGYFFVPKRVSD